MPKKKGPTKACSISAVNEFFGEGSFENTEDAPKPPRMKMVPYIYVPLPAPKKVDHLKAWNNTENTLDKLFPETRMSKDWERRTTTTSGDDE